MLLLFLLGAACEREESSGQARQGGGDLLPRLARAEVLHQHVDLLWDATVRREGWQPVERDGEGKPLRAVREHASVDFVWLGVGEVELEVLAESIGAGAGSGVGSGAGAAAGSRVGSSSGVGEVSLALDGHAVGSVALADTDRPAGLSPAARSPGSGGAGGGTASRRPGSLILPRGALSIGWNRLDLTGPARYRVLRLGGASGSAAPPPGAAIDLGASSDEGFLGEGWGKASREAGRTLRPIKGPEAAIRFDLARPRTRSLTLSMRARQRPDLPAPLVEVRINGKVQGVLLVPGGWIDRAILVDAGAWVEGRNEVRLRLGSTGEAGEAAAGGEVAGDEVAGDEVTSGEKVAGPAKPIIEVDGIQAAPLADLDVPRVENGRILQETRTAIDLYLRLPPGKGSRMRFTVEAPAAESPSSLAVSIEQDGLPAREIWRRDALRGVETARFALGGDGGEPACIRFLAGGDPGSVLVWRELTLEASPAAAEDAAPAAERASAAPPARAEQGEATSVLHPNILLYVIDTLRADHVGIYGYPRPTTPRIDAFAAGGIRFDPVLAVASWTRPATATLLTGVYPTTHGATDRFSVLSPDVTLIAETLRRAGYRTAGIFTNPQVLDDFGFDRGWDLYHYVNVGSKTSTSSQPLQEATHAILPRLASGSKPFFLYLHSFDPHTPYDPPLAYRGFCDPQYKGGVTGYESAIQGLREAIRRDGRGAHEADLRHLIDLYDGAIRHNDDSFGELLDDLAAQGLLESTAVVLTADHGEEFLDHGGFLHGETLYQDQLRVPLVVRLPGAAPRRRGAGGAARQIDVAPTILDLAGLDLLPQMRGRSLLRPSRGESVSFAEDELDTNWLWSLVEGRTKLHRWRNPSSPRAGGARDEVWELDARGRETRRIDVERPVLAGYLRAEARWIHAELPRPRRGMAGVDTIDPSTVKQLRALGYLK